MYIYRFLPFYSVCVRFFTTFAYLTRQSANWTSKLFWVNFQTQISIKPEAKFHEKVFFQKPLLLFPIEHQMLMFA
ncbi:hypothetical protein CK516_23770 [Nostoc sp. 'Peltigera malacea cyanobiont' DB3992]|nr:hypothetical protein CK516_23770 [Nostoc sp. 'Peltigera malacea cyanobiont' DB3992]